MVSDTLLRTQVWEIQQSLVDSLSAAATVLVKAEQDTSGTLKDARPHCAARIALSKAVSAASLARLIVCRKSCSERGLL